MSGIKVEGHPNLERDRVTGAVNNINRGEIKRARMAKAKRLAEKEQKEKLDERVEKIEEEIKDVKSLMHQLLEAVDKVGK